MDLSSFGSPHAVSPLDGRYRCRLGKDLDDFSEFGQTRLRVLVEISYLAALGTTRGFILPPALEEVLRDFSEEDFQDIKAVEAKINHDVKAVEMWVASKAPGLEAWVHFGLTSQDVAGTAYVIGLQRFIPRFVHRVGQVFDELTRLVSLPRMPMLGRTHGQPATPTSMNAELGVFIERLRVLVAQKPTTLSTKFGGAVGKLNAHYVALPSVDWSLWMDGFVKSLGLTRNQKTTQVDHYDNYAMVFQWMSRVATVLVDLCRDIWIYLSLGYLTLEKRAEEVGSSTMPHKVNPMHFENAEGNLELAVVLLSFLSLRLPRSRLQRDLTDSTLCRNIGVALGHLLIALQALGSGLSRLSFCPAKASQDLDDHPEVLAEAYQTILRREGFSDAYERLKSLTRVDGKMTLETMHQWVDAQGDVAFEVKEELKALRPCTYLGVAAYE